jgi:hypothetical protein
VDIFGCFPFGATKLCWFLTEFLVEVGIMILKSRVAMFSVMAKQCPSPGKDFVGGVKKGGFCLHDGGLNLFVVITGCPPT